MSNKIGLYTKAILAAAVVGANSAVTALGDGHIELSEWIVISSATVAGLAGVWAVPNTPAPVQKYGKMITAGILAGLGSLLTAVAADALDASSIINIVIAIISGLGLIAVAPNARQSEDPVLVKREEAIAALGEDPAALPVDDEHVDEEFIESDEEVHETPAELEGRLS